jgi:hypothetical protein
LRNSYKTEYNTHVYFMKIADFEWKNSRDLRREMKKAERAVDSWRKKMNIFTVFSLTPFYIIEDVFIAEAADVN